MLKETSTEKGCFRGCFVAIAIGAVIGMVVAWFLTNTAVQQDTTGMPAAVGSGAAASIRFMAMVVGGLAGSIVGGLGGLIWERLTVKREKEIDSF